MKKYGNEFKVGLFVTLCVLGLAYLVLSTGKLNFKKQGYYVYVAFNDISGLQTKAPVLLNGLEIGKVENIVVSYEGEDTLVKVKLWINQKEKIRTNSVASIKSLGLMGEKYVYIASSREKGFVLPEAMLLGKASIDLDVVLEQVQGISKDISRLLVSLDTVVSDNKGSVSNFMKNLEATSANLEEFSDDLKRHPWKLLMKGKEKPAKEKMNK